MDKLRKRFTICPALTENTGHDQKGCGKETHRQYLFLGKVKVMEDAIIPESD